MFSWILRFFRRAPSPAPTAPPAADIAVEPMPTPVPAAMPVAQGETEALAPRLERELQAALDTVTRASDDVDLVVDALRVAQFDGLRQMPPAAQRVLALTQREEPDARAIIALIGEDPALAQAVLAASGAAFYGGAACRSIPEAVNRLGAAGVRNAVLGVAVSGLLCRPGRALDGMVAAVWSHLQRCGPLAHALAPAFAAHPDEAFTAGLLHDVGKLLVFDAVTRVRRTLQRDPVLTPERLKLLLAAAHEPLGGLAVLHWRLGDDIARAVASHHRSPVPAQRDCLGEVVHLAERLDLARAHGKPSDLEKIWREAGLTGAAARIPQLLEQAA